MTRRVLFTSESVTEGHPDKVCDRVSDAVLDAVLARDENRRPRVACETFATTNRLVISGEITALIKEDINELAEQEARAALRDIGYTDEAFGISADTCEVDASIKPQSPDIAQGVDTGGAGDQGMMFGYAVAETPTLMPFPMYLSHRLALRLASYRKERGDTVLRPDGKTQVTLDYNVEDGADLRWVPQQVQNIVISTQHSPEATQDELRAILQENVIDPIIADTEDKLSIDQLLGDDWDFFCNETGKFVMGGPQADAGLTGRKIIVDTYGGRAPHGGGAFSGKDPTKVDRSAAYATRWIAKNIVAAGLASECTLQVAYSIGVAEPVSLLVDTHGTHNVPEEDIEAWVRDNCPLTPAWIIEELDLLNPERNHYAPLTAGGHFGRDDLQPVPTWEELGLMESIQDAFRDADLSTPDFEVL